MNVIIYGTPECTQCLHTKAFLDKQETEFEYRDVTTNDEWRKEALVIVAEHVLLQNYPIVVVSNKHRRDAWSGFKIEKIRGLRETGDY